MKYLKAIARISGTETEPSYFKYASVIKSARSMYNRGSVSTLCCLNFLTRAFIPLASISQPPIVIL